MSDTAKLAEEYLKQPYSRVLIPDEETGTYTAQIIEFPGCVAQGNTVQEAYERLEVTAVSWIEAALDLHQDIPLPMSAYEYGGKVALRLPKSLHRQATLAAQRDGTSLNQFIAMAVSEKIGASDLYYRLAERLEHRVFQTAASTVLPIIVADLWHTSQAFHGNAANLASAPSPYIDIYRKPSRVT